MANRFHYINVFNKQLLRARNTLKINLTDCFLTYGLFDTMGVCDASFDMSVLLMFTVITEENTDDVSTLEIVSHPITDSCLLVRNTHGTSFKSG